MDQGRSGCSAELRFCFAANNDPRGTLRGVYVARYCKKPSAGGSSDTPASEGLRKRNISNLAGSSSMRGRCAGAPILAPAFAWPKHVVLIDVMVLFSGSIGKTWRPHAWRKITTNSLSEAQDQACSARRASCQFPRPVCRGLIAQSASKPSIKNRPSTATNAAIGSDKTCKFGLSDYARG